jgi:hypothetical protein
MKDDNATIYGMYMLKKEDRAKKVIYVWNTITSRRIYLLLVIFFIQ